MHPNILRHPGPTPIPKNVEMAMNQYMISHRSSEFVELYQKATERIKPIFGTEQDILLIPSGGAAALEAAVVNTASPGDEVVVITIGAFGDYFASMCEKRGLTVHKLSKDWGEACTEEDLISFLKPLSNIKAVFATFNETSTGILNPIKQLSEVVHHHSDALFIVDGVSCIGGVTSEMDQWGIDILVTGSQKAMMLPPGLAFVAVSERAWKVIESNPTNVYYLDLLSYREWSTKGMTPNTPAVSLIMGLLSVCDMIDEEGGISKTAERHELMKNMVRGAMKALSIDLLTSDEYASPTITAVRSPEGLNLTDYLGHLKKKYHLDFAGGLGPLQGEIFRIGHMGYCFPSDILEAVSLMEAALQDFSYEFEPGVGVNKAQNIFLSSLK